MASAEAERNQGDQNQQLGEIGWQDVAAGMDIQGIPWDALSFSREDCRATRMRDGRDREGHGESSDRDVAASREVRRDSEFYSFHKNTRKAKSSIIHFQLRNLVWATSRHDVYTMYENQIMHWDAAACERRCVLDLSGVKRSKDDSREPVILGRDVAPLGRAQISTMIAKNDLLVTGGFSGEMVAKNLKTNVVECNCAITTDENAITNAIDIYNSCVMTSSNDKYVRIFDATTFSKVFDRKFEMPVNHATRQPSGKMVAIVGDHKNAVVIDGDSGEQIGELIGHMDYSFATAWHPDGMMFATGSQDDTCRIWDLRNMSQSLAILKAHIGAVRSVRFSSCGRFLAMSEPQDFVHIYDTSRGDFDCCQEIDFFGDIAGITFSPDADSLFIGIYDRAYGSLLEYRHKLSK